MSLVTSPGISWISAAYLQIFKIANISVSIRFKKTISARLLLMYLRLHKALYTLRGAEMFHKKHLETQPHEIIGLLSTYG